jgi:glycosyltransferase involved in cell wall biosynthesis
MVLNKKMTFFVLLYPASSSNILDSQVYPKAKILSELGWDCQFIGADIAEKCTDQYVKHLKDQYGFKNVTIFPSFPKKANYFSLATMLKSIRQEVYKGLVDWRPAWVYFRNIFEYEALNQSVRSMGAKCVYDVRGALSSELRHTCPGLKGRIKEIFIKSKEIKIFRRADHLLCVSSNMKEWIAKVSGRVDATVIPCCADQECFHPDENTKRTLRAKLGWSGDSPVITYVGGASYWQRPEDVVKLLGQLKMRIAGLKVVVLTNSVETFTQMFATTTFSSEDLYIRKVPHGEVGSWINVADLGLILRHDLLLNNVSSPIKIGEYLAAGLAVICTNGIGDYSRAIAMAQAGVVLNEVQVCDDLLQLIQNPQRLAECRRNALLLSNRYSRIYEREQFRGFLEVAGC